MTARGNDQPALGGARVAVVVLGDLGRSPRMLHHAAALLHAGAAVDLIGHAGAPLPAPLAATAGLTVHHLPGPRLAARHALPRAAFLAYGAARLIGASARLATVLRRLPAPDVVLVQNPPALPTLAVVPPVARWRGAGVVIDWHNFACTQLGLTVGAAHPAVRAARAVERRLGRGATAHLCVSAAMRATLAASWGIADAHVLRDRPVTFVPADQRAAARARLAARLALPVDAEPRPALLVSPTSWSADEDTDLLLDALGRLEATLDGSALRLVCVLTGDGPRRADFEARVAARHWQRVAVRTIWLDPGDYPALLAGADLGLSLHRSTSGVDLPMKIADLHGAGVPVCAFDYGPCLREMLSQAEAAIGFTQAAGLAARLRSLLDALTQLGSLEALRDAVAALPQRTWEEGWRDEALPLFASLIRDE
ncbi:MAG: glycosyltransferase [Deltaproteobacteria bacterium]|nr:glycosyltransferase [Deltaproteobacteria bacterium]